LACPLAFNPQFLPILPFSLRFDCMGVAFLTGVVAPTPPAEIPDYAQLDPSTRLHVTGTAQQIDLASYRLKVTGKVEHPLSLSYDDLRCMLRVEQYCTLVCPGLFEDRATWAGASLATE
jgi:DMSO/TMAO reductase YedYZ molybdopterin-dependent catalytic subunit